MPNVKVSWDAELSERVTTYWLLSGALILTAALVGIVFVLVRF